ncbi:MAG: hypothetical protein U0176_05960 [Bacteroidia bacterium]
MTKQRKRILFGTTGLATVVLIMTLWFEMSMHSSLAPIREANTSIFGERESSYISSIWYFSRPLLGISNQRYTTAADRLKLNQAGTGFSPYKLGFLVAKYFSEAEIDSILR